MRLPWRRDAFTSKFEDATEMLLAAEAGDDVMTPRLWSVLMQSFHRTHGTTSQRPKKSGRKRTKKEKEALGNIVHAVSGDTRVSYLGRCDNGELALVFA